jgi:phage terminase large subunit-like protein
LIASLSVEERNELLGELSESQAHALLYDWRGFWARPNQLAPPGSWRYWLLQAGRGFGKTRVGAETVREWSDKYPRIHLVAPTAADARDVMIEGESGLINCFPPNSRPVYEPSKRRVTFPNGSMAFAFSADEPERLRGPQCHAFWADELAAWRFPEAWDNLLFGFRLGSDPRGVITTTPKPTKLVRDIVGDPNTVITRGTSYDNRANLAPAFFDAIIRKYEGSRLGRQELLAELLEDMAGAIFKRALIEAARIRLDQVRWDLVVRIVVAIDPAVTNTEDSDETGIVVCALTRSSHILVLDDLSCRDTPLGWARIAISAFHTRRADRIVGEVNNGGDLVESNIRVIGPNVPFRKVRASRGKAVRAEPLAALYEQGRVHHIGYFEKLETQMCEYVPGVTEKSPDRMDALVWAAAELLTDEEEMNIAATLGGGYQISPI